MSMFPIASYTYTSTGAGVDFTSIPQNFTHLQLRIFARVTGYPANTPTLGQLYYNFNGDGGSNYNSHGLYGDGSSASSAVLGAANFPVLGNQVVANGASANIFSCVVVDILDYANTNKYKVLRSLCGSDLNGSGRVTLSSSLWMNTAAINRITLVPDGSNMITGSTVQLYGISTSSATGA